MRGLLSLTPTLLALACASRYESVGSDDPALPAGYWERHKKKVLSPHELTEQFQRQQKKNERAETAKEAYLHSPQHHMEVMRASNKEALQARRRLSSDDESLLPAPATSVKVQKEMGCGSRISAEEMGLKDADTNRHFFEQSRVRVPSALLQGAKKSGPSMAVPKAGSAQELADNGRSITGRVAGAEKDKWVEPLFKVFKDGYSFTICAKDAMYEFGDKYGDNADKYKMDFQNISIVKYSEIILQEKQTSAMTPKICYEFCRTMPDMGYFGLIGGRDCYCTPFFKKTASGSDNCDLPCPGDQMQMCGGKEKSQLYEMHMCMDTAGDLLYSAVKAEVELVYFYDTAFITDKIAQKLQAFGELLQDIAGQSDPGASDLAQEAKKEAGSLFDASTGWGMCQREFTMLLKEYNKAKPLYDEDFSFVDAIQAAEDGIVLMNGLAQKLHACAKSAEAPILATFPFYFEFMASLDEIDWQKRADKVANALVDFYPAPYYKDTDAPEEMSSCGGEVAGRPMPIPLGLCAEACDRMTYPVRCAAFQYFQMLDGDTVKPLCFLFKEVTSIRTYRCDMIGDSFLQENTSKSQSSLRGPAVADQKAPYDPTKELCKKVKRAKAFSGLSCQSMFGKESKVVSDCPDECEDTSGAKITALCMARLSLAPPRLEAKQIRQCFGKGNGAADQAGADYRLVEFGTDASGGAGPKIEGDIKMGGGVVEEPYGHVWTPGPAGQR